MKKVSIQFNATIDNNITHKELHAILRERLGNFIADKCGNKIHTLTSIQVNNVVKK